MARLLCQGQKLTILDGAGASTSSGMPLFAADTPDFFDLNSPSAGHTGGSNILELVRWCGTVRAQRAEASQSAYYTFVDNMFRRSKIDKVISTNVDGLLQQWCDIPYHSRIFCLHSTVDQLVCSLCSSTWQLSYQDAVRLRDHPRVSCAHCVNRTRIRHGTEIEMRCNLPAFYTSTIPIDNGMHPTVPPEVPDASCQILGLFGCSLKRPAIQHFVRQLIQASPHAVVLWVNMEKPPRFIRDSATWFPQSVDEFCSTLSQPLGIPTRGRLSLKESSRYHVQKFIREYCPQKQRSRAWEVSLTLCGSFDDPKWVLLRFAMLCAE